MRNFLGALVALLFPIISTANGLEFNTKELQCLFGNGRPTSKPVVAHSPSQYEDIIWKGFHDSFQEFLVSQQQNIYFATPDYRDRVKNLKLKEPGKYEYEYMLKVRPDLQKFFEVEEPPMLLMESCRFPNIDFASKSAVFAHIEGCLSSYEIKGEENKEKKQYLVNVIGVQTKKTCPKPISKDLIIVVDTPKPNWDIVSQQTIEKR